MSVLDGGSAISLHLRLSPQLSSNVATAQSSTAVAANGDREPDRAAGLAVDVMAAIDAQKNLAAPLDQTSKGAADIDVIR